MIETVLMQQVIQGTVISRSVLLPAPATREFAGEVVMAEEDQNDPALSIVLTLQISLQPGHWEPVATQEWPASNGTGYTPEVCWYGMARRVRLVIDVSRPVSAGATLTF